MGLIINIIIIIVLAVAITGSIAYNNPQKAKILAIQGLKKIAPELIDINPKDVIDDFKERLPDNLKEIIDKNPTKEQDFEKDSLFPETTQKKEILGRPRKVVEFFCTSDIQCKNYFLKSNAQCETESGICFI